MVKRTNFPIIYLFKVIGKNKNVIPQYLSADLYFFVFDFFF